MEDIKAVVKRLTVLYYVFLVVIVLAVGVSLRGLITLQSDALDDRLSTEITEKRTANTDFLLVRGLKYTNSVQDTISLNDKAMVEIMPTKFDALLFVDGEEIYEPAIDMLMFYSRVGVVVLSLCFGVVFLMLAWTLGRSIFRNDIFNRRSVVLLKWFAVLLVVLVFSSDILSWVDRLVVAQYMNVGHTVVDVSFPWNFSSIIVGLLVYMFAEILSVGVKLKQDSDLTI